MFYNELTKEMHVTVRETGEELKCVSCPLDWQLAGLQQTATGYGSKLATEWKVSYLGALRRVYAACFSNAATYYVLVKGRKVTLY